MEVTRKKKKLYRVTQKKNPLQGRWIFFFLLVARDILAVAVYCL